MYRRIYRTSVLFFAMAIAGVSVGCWGGDDNATPAPTPSLSATAEAPSPTLSPTLAPPTATETSDPSPTATAPATEELDAVVEAVTRGNADQIQALFEGTPTKCVAQPIGVGSPPKCPEGTPGGALIPVVRAMACEFVYPDHLSQLTTEWTAFGRELFAIYPGSAKTPHSDWITRGEHVVVVNQPDLDRGAAFQVDAGRIVGIEFGCGFTAARFVEGVPPGDFIVAPGN